MSDSTKTVILHGGLLALLFLLQFLLPAYHHGNLARIMVLATFAMGYNVMFGYTGLLTLGHALFFAAGMYGMGLAMQYAGAGPVLAMGAGLVASIVVALVVGLLALRTAGVGFMIVTLMFAQAGYLIILYYGAWTRGDEGLVMPQALRMLGAIDFSQPGPRYFAALGLFATGFLLTLWMMRSPFGKVLIAIRENEERARMLGYDVFRYKLAAVVISGTLCGLAGAAYGLLFGYVGATFASVQYSIFPLLWVLLGGAGTVIGPLIGTLFMFYLIDLSSAVTSAYMLVAGVVLVLLTLFAPQGLAGELRARVWRGLP